MNVLFLHVFYSLFDNFGKEVIPIFLCVIAQEVKAIFLFVCYLDFNDHGWCFLGEVMFI